MFGECCFNVGDVKITMGTGTFMNINTGNKPHTSVAGKAKYTHVEIVPSRCVHAGTLRAGVCPLEVCILWWGGRLAQSWCIWPRATQQTQALPSNGHRSWVSDEWCTVRLTTICLSNNVKTVKCEGHMKNTISWNHGKLSMFTK